MENKNTVALFQAFKAEFKKRDSWTWNFVTCPDESVYDFSKEVVFEDLRGMKMTGFHMHNGAIHFFAMSETGRINYLKLPLDK